GDAGAELLDPAGVLVAEHELRLLRAGRTLGEILEDRDIRMAGAGASHFQQHLARSGHRLLHVPEHGEGLVVLEYDGAHGTSFSPDGLHGRWMSGELAQRSPRSCSTMAGFSSVEMSCVISSPRAIARSRRRM